MNVLNRIQIIDGQEIYLVKNVYLRNYLISIQKKNEKISINPLTVHGEDLTQVAFSERLELSEFLVLRKSHLCWILTMYS